MIIVRPTGSPSTIKDCAGGQEDQHKGVGKKTEKSDQASEARLLTRLFRPWIRSRCVASVAVSPAGVAQTG